ncbi:hypothetical protein P691DRAFT_779755 [Macrolepiota fuliginosa MF-IS2]|uniref:Uncharacterized protein n=1 Tax=Macrolepiota fuliginosa MF-IS2 TaxID=1400762 RepID=A0A9P5WZ74_9AGAR|nr:hypothetical protein P691DRAFT_779755 [Macrolepiota fuliginosa MF-IS2]
MAPLTDPRPRFSYKVWDGWSSINTTKSVNVLLESDDGWHQPEDLTIYDSSPLRPSRIVRVGHSPALGFNAVTGLPSSDPPTQTPNGHGFITPCPTPGFPPATQTPQVRPTSTQVLVTGINTGLLFFDHSPSATVTGFLMLASTGEAPTSKLVTTTFVTSDVFTTHIVTTSTLSNGHRERLTLTSSGTRRITTTAKIVAQTGPTGSSNGPPEGKGGLQQGAIGGVIGATILVILGLVVFFVFRHKHRKLVISPSSFVTSEPPAPRMTEISTPVLPRPFLALTPAIQYYVTKVQRGGNKQISPPLLRPQYNQAPNAGDNRDPFRDPKIPGEDIPEREVQGARNALGRLQRLTSQLEAGLLELNNLARPTHLSGDECTQLTTGSTTPFNQRHGHLSVVSNETNHSAVPPSYHSERGHY